MFAGGLVIHVGADLSFDNLIADTCPKGMPRRLHHSVSALLTESRRKPIQNTAVARMQTSIAEHRAVQAALQGNDPGNAAQAMASHIGNTADCVGVTV